MPAALLSREEVVARVMAVVRHHGYDGASIAELSKATGLGKSSLYHHFPDGKEDMVGAVLGYLELTLEAAVFAPLRSERPPVERIRAMSKTLDAFYDHGRESCVLAILGIGDAARPFHPRIRTLFRTWIDTLAAVLRDGGLSRTVAHTRAVDAIVRIEGALVLARAMDEPAIFGRTLRALSGDLLRH